MATRRKDKLIETLHYPGMEIEALLTPENRFKAVVYNKTLHAATYNELTNMVRKAVEEGNQISWQPIIHLIYLEPWVGNKAQAFLGFDKDRLNIGQSCAGKWFWISWDALKWYPEQIAQNMRPFTHDTKDQNGKVIPFTLPHNNGYWTQLGQREVSEWKSSYREPTEFWVPYSEDIWQALTAMEEMLKNAREKLHDMFKSPDGMQQVLAITSGSHTLIGMKPKEIEP